jgi:hypothetical protein
MHRKYPNLIATDSSSGYALSSLAKQSRRFTARFAGSQDGCLCADSFFNIQRFRRDYPGRPPAEILNFNIVSACKRAGYLTTRLNP